MKRVLFLMGVALMAVSSCSRDEIKEINRGNAIGFRTAAVSKAEEITTSDLESFSVTAFNEGDVSTPFFSDVEFMEMGEHFFSASSYYWPTDGSSLVFYAYYPSSAVLGDVPEMVAGELCVSYTPSSDITSQVDFITATAEGSSEDATTGVLLEFGHRLAQVQIRAKSSNANYIYKVKGVRIGNVAGGGTFCFDDLSWSDLQTKTTYEVVYADDEVRTLETGAKSLMASSGDNAMLIPQQLVAWQPSVQDDEGSYLGVYVNISTPEGVRIFPEETMEYGWVATPIATNWVAGNLYDYVLDFSSGAGYVAPDDPVSPGEVLDADIEFTLDVNEWNERSTVNQLYADMVGTWKAYKFDQYDYNSNDEITDISVLFEDKQCSYEYAYYGDFDTPVIYDEDRELMTYRITYSKDDVAAVEDLYAMDADSYIVENIEAVLADPANVMPEVTDPSIIEKIEIKTLEISGDGNNPIETTTIIYNDGVYESHTVTGNVTTTSTYFFEGPERLREIAGGPLSYFKISEENTSIIWPLDDNGVEIDGQFVPFSMEDDYMIIPTLDAEHTRPHVDDISTDAQGNKIATLSIDRRTSTTGNGSNHLQHIYYRVTSNN